MAVTKQHHQQEGGRIPQTSTHTRHGVLFYLEGFWHCIERGTGHSVHDTARIYTSFSLTPILFD